MRNQPSLQQKFQQTHPLQAHLLRCFLHLHRNHRNRPQSRRTQWSPGRRLAPRALNTHLCHLFRRQPNRRLQRSRRHQKMIPRLRRRKKSPRLCRQHGRRSLHRDLRPQPHPRQAQPHPRQGPHLRHLPRSSQCRRRSRLKWAPRRLRPHLQSQCPLLRSRPLPESLQRRAALRRQCPQPRKLRHLQLQHRLPLRLRLQRNPKSMA